MSYIEFIKQNQPSVPATDRVRIYTDTSTGEPFFINDLGVIQSMKGTDGSVGATGAQGIQGIQGIQGNVGAVGPAGPTTVDFFNSRTATVTLPNSTAKQIIFSDSVTIAGTGDCYLLVSLVVKGHSTGNDMEFDIDFDGTILSPVYAEEHKDNNVNQAQWRMAILDLGNLAASTYNMDLRFSKEQTGGTAELKAYTTSVVRYT